MNRGGEGDNGTLTLVLACFDACDLLTPCISEEKSDSCLSESKIHTCSAAADGQQFNSVTAV